MAQGDVQASIQSVASNGVINIQPPSGAEWVIHNLYWNQGTVQVFKTDGTNLLQFKTDTSMGGLLNTEIHLTNGQYLQIKNTAGTATLIGYDGVQTK